MAIAVEQEIAFGPFRLDRGNARLLRDGRPVAITPKAFDVLDYLARRPDKLVTKDELLSAVWPDVIVGDASVKVCVRESRKALDDGAKTPKFIETVHRRGYRFIGAATPLAATPAAPVAGPPPAIRMTAPAAPARASHAQPLVVGRGREIEQLRECLTSAAGGERQVVFVTGAPGSGKTAVVDSFVARAAFGDGERPLVLSGCCFEQFGTGEPYLPVWDALGRAARERPSPPLCDLLTRRGGAASPPVASEPRAMSNRVLHELVEVLEGMAADAPVVLLLEDVHWADYSTVDLLSALARRRGAAKLMVVATFRPAEPSLQKHPLRGVVRELLTARLCREVSLEPLGREAVAEYLATRFDGGGLPAAFVRRLHQRTEGHPLFLTHLIDDLVEQGVLLEDAGKWRLAGDAGSPRAWMAVLDTQVPRSVRGMIELQIERLTADEQEVLESAAVAGVEFSAAAAAAALGRDVVEIERVCDAFVRRHRFLEQHGYVEWPDGTVATHYRFVHELYHNVVYERVPAARRARLHAALGLRMEQAWGGRGAEEAAQLAVHFEVGRDWTRAARYLRTAADAACRQYAHREAADYLRRALAALDRLPAQNRVADELELLMNLSVNVQVTSGCAAPEVKEILDRAKSLARSEVVSRDVGTLFPVLWANWVFHKVRSDLAEAAELARELLKTAADAGDSALMLQAHQAMAVTSLCLGDFAAVRDQMERAARVYDPVRHPANTMRFGQDPGVATLAFGAVALCIAGEESAAVDAAGRAVAVARNVSQPSTLNLALHFAATVHQLRGDSAVTLACADESIRLAGEEGFSFWLAGGKVLRGWAMAEQGSADEGVAEIRRGLDEWLATGSRTYHSYYLGLLAGALMRRGTSQDAADALTTLDRALDTARELQEGLYEAELHRRKGLCVLNGDADDLQAARACFELARDTARRQGAGLFERWAAEDLARISAAKPRRRTASSASLTRA